MLPLEAIELEAFRRRHEHDTFWCGLLLGGCGLQLTTKLYTGRVCRFAHHPGPDGHPHLCGRRARGVSSADCLYVKWEAAAWLCLEQSLSAGLRGSLFILVLGGEQVGSHCRQQALKPSRGARCCSSWRRRARARCSVHLTAPGAMPRAVAVSSVDICSQCRSTTTLRCWGVSVFMMSVSRARSACCSVESSMGLSGK